MAKVITITNGTGTSNIINGNFNVTSNVNGYDNTSINPSSVNITEDTNTYQFTISASGTLTLHVTEDGTAMFWPLHNSNTSVNIAPISMSFMFVFIYFLTKISKSQYNLE